MVAGAEDTTTETPHTMSDIFDDDATFFDDKTISTTSQPVNAENVVLPEFDSEPTQPETAEADNLDRLWRDALGLVPLNVAALDRIHASRDDETRVYTAAADNLRTRLGSVNGWLAALATMSRLHQHTLDNQFLIAAQDPEASQVGTPRGWAHLGRTVHADAPRVGVLAETAAGSRVIRLTDIRHTTGRPYRTGHARWSLLWEEANTAAELAGLTVVPSGAKHASVDVPAGEIRIPFDASVGSATRALFQSLGTIPALRAGFGLTESLVIREAVGTVLARANGALTDLEGPAQAVDKWLGGNPAGAEVVAVAEMVADTARSALATGVFSHATAGGGIGTD